MKTRRSSPPVPIRLSSRLRPLFWDHDFARLTWAADSDLIIGRVLAAGDGEAVVWLRRTMGNVALQHWLERRAGPN